MGGRGGCIFFFSLILVILLNAEMPEGYQTLVTDEGH